MRAEKLLARLPDAIVLMDQYGKITGWHGAAQQLLGWTADEAIGKHANELLRPRVYGGGAAELPPSSVDPVLGTQNSHAGSSTAAEGPKRPVSLDKGDETGVEGADQKLSVNTSDETGVEGTDQELSVNTSDETGVEGTDQELSVNTSDESGVGITQQELLIKGKDESDVWVGVAWAVQRATGRESTEYIACFRDISERKGVDLAKSDVISSVAHELRSPLTSIKGFAATLVKRWDRFEDARRRQILATIEADADRVTRLISELLDLSRLEEGRLQLRKQPVQVAMVADRVVGHLKERTGRHSLACNFPHPFPTVMADADKVEQVLTNLIENALKYTEQGEVQVGGRVDGSAVRIAVMDQGSGIPLDHRRDVFRKFFRRTDHYSTGSPVQPGTGLGLYISKGLIEAHGGTIWVEEAPGGGACFAFTLPLR